MHRLFFLALIFLSSLSQASLKKYPALFKAGDMQISTFEQFDKRVRETFPELELRYEELETVTYNEKTYKGLNLTAHGIMGGTKVTQKLTYILLHKDLWRLTFINGETCILGELLRNNQWVQDWACETLEYPVGGAFADIFIIDNDQVDLKSLSQSWGREVVLNNTAQESPPVEKTLTLGDLKKKFQDEGSTWETQTTTWINQLVENASAKPGLNIRVTGSLDSEYRFDQSFLYFVDGELLRLKEISGKLCRYVERMKKDICEDAYYPTKATPFPMLLVNSLELSSSTSALSNEDTPLVVETNSAKFSCGHLADNFLTAMKFHFERGIFTAQDIQNYRKAISQLAMVSDPQRLFLSEATFENYEKINQAPYAYDQELEALKEQMNLGSRGNCDSLLPLVEELKEEILSQNQNISALISFIEEHQFQPEQIELNLHRLDERAQQYWPVIKLSSDPALRAFPQKAIDVGIGNLRQYMKQTVDRMSDPEELLTAAFVKQDAYSQLLNESLVLQTGDTLNGVSKRKYFGLQVASGYKNHYIASVHPDTKKRGNILVGDQIISLNGRKASEMTAKNIDDILLNINQPLKFILDRDGVQIDVELNSDFIDPLKSVYSTELVGPSPENQYLKIKIKSFEAGLAESLLSEVKSLMNNHSIRGFIVDLQSNPGGNAQEAIYILSFFIKNQNLSYYRLGSRSLETAEALRSVDEFYISDSLPLVVQVDGFSQSASEIFASTIKDLNRGLIIGGNTYGKLVGQNYFPVTLSNQRTLGMVITTTEYFSPSGQSLNGKGIQPHVLIYSGSMNKNSDGTGEGKDYSVSEQPFQYPDMVSTHRLKTIKESLLLDQTDIDLATLEILNATENIAFAQK